MKQPTFKISRRDVIAALHTSAPIMVTFIVLGIGYGILMQKHGYGPIWSLLSGIIIYPLIWMARIAEELKGIAVELGVEGPYASWWHMFGWNVFGLIIDGFGCGDHAIF